jgi:hypothetical protein
MDCLGFHGIPAQEMIEYFSPMIPDGYSLPHGFNWKCGRFFKGKMIHEKFPSRVRRSHRRNILVFPRYREYRFHGVRNLPESFYRDLIIRICKSFPTNIVMTLGTKNGAYSIDAPTVDNYLNFVGETKCMQDLIDFCETAVCAIGGTSAPPKIALMQGVPTYIIGHEHDRFVHEENWMNTEVAFFPIKLEEYNAFCDETCMENVINWIGLINK